MELQGAGRRAVERDPLEIGLLERQIAVSERAARDPRLRATPPVDEGVRGLCPVDVHADLMPHLSVSYVRRSDQYLNSGTCVD